ncbi:MAG: ribosome silencing factor [Dehalococcoidia bacterium]
MARWSWSNVATSDIIWKEVSAFLEAEEIARLATELASEKQARDIAMLDVRALCSFADYFVICTGDTKRHIEAIWQGIGGVLKTKGVVTHHNEGTPDSGWMLADFGSVIVHIFAPLERDYYQLDKLWDKVTPVVRIQ